MTKIDKETMAKGTQIKLFLTIETGKMITMAIKGIPTIEIDKMMTMAIE